jgi:hypothetical protein
MSEENVRLVKQLFVAWTAGDVETCVAAFDPEGESVDAPHRPLTLHRSSSSRAGVPRSSKSNTHAAAARSMPVKTI